MACIPAPGWPVSLEFGYTINTRPWILQSIYSIQFVGIKRAEHPPPDHKCRTFRRRGSFLFVIGRVFMVPQGFEPHPHFFRSNRKKSVIPLDHKTLICRLVWEIPSSPKQYRKYRIVIDTLCIVYIGCNISGIRVATVALHSAWHSCSASLYSAPQQKMFVTIITIALKSS